MHVAIEENNATRRLQLITLLADSLEEEDALLEEDFCYGTWRGSVRPVLRVVRVVRSRCRLRGIRAGEASHPGPTTGPTRRDTSSDEEPVNRLGEVRNVGFRVADIRHPPPSAHVDVVDMTVADTDTATVANR